jgi:hypothetical protein
MDERLSPSKKNIHTAYAGTVLLHSAYDPIREAERYIESLEIKKDIKHFILLEPALSYIIPFLRKKNPDANVLALRCSTFFKGKENPDAEWFCESGESLQSFLEHHINDSDISKIKIIEWRPSLEAYGEKYVSMLEAIRIFLKRSAANITTTKFFGLRWIKNCLKNINALNKIVTFKTGTCSVLVCGAGPSLEKSVALIKQFQEKEKLFIIAASSSVLALQERGIIPHLVIGSDGGNWARIHFIECERFSAYNYFFCTALNAALPSQCNEHPMLILSDGSDWQSLLLEKLFIPHLHFPQRGTVTAAALDLALQLTSGNIFVAGMDLSERDLLTHARPYAFDTMILLQSNRFHPYYSQIFKRKEQENTGALTIYAEWFQQYTENHKGRIFSLGNNNAVFSTLHLHQKEESIVSQEKYLPEFSMYSLPKNNQSSLEILIRAIENNESKIINEVLELLHVDNKKENVSSVLKQKLLSLCETGN